MKLNDFQERDEEAHSIWNCGSQDILHDGTHGFLLRLLNRVPEDVLRILSGLAFLELCWHQIEGCITKHTHTKKKSHKPGFDLSRSVLCCADRMNEHTISSICARFLSKLAKGGTKLRRRFSVAGPHKLCVEHEAHDVGHRSPLSSIRQFWKVLAKLVQTSLDLFRAQTSRAIFVEVLLQVIRERVGCLHHMHSKVSFTVRQPLKKAFVAIHPTKKSAARPAARMVAETGSTMLGGCRTEGKLCAVGTKFGSNKRGSGQPL